MQNSLYVPAFGNAYVNVRRLRLRAVARGESPPLDVAAPGIVFGPNGPNAWPL